MYYRFHLLKRPQEKEAASWLKKNGLKHIYVLEEGSTCEIGGFGEVKNLLPPYLKLIEIKEETVNWDDQWEKKIIEIPLGNLSFLLESGPGFGDANHPTTQLMLYWIKRLKPQKMIDIGAGSGVLTVAALKLGAKSVLAVEIDEGAILHHQKNLKLNQLEAMEIYRYLPMDLSLFSDGLVAINMILSEQQEVIAQSSPLLKLNTYWIASGFLETQRDQALAYYTSLGVEVLGEKYENGWGSFYMKKRG